MNQSYEIIDIFYDFLPETYDLKIQYHPILYVLDVEHNELLGVYSFDRYSEIIYVSDPNKECYWYISLREFRVRQWELYDVEKFEKYFYTQNEDLPF